MKTSLEIRQEFIDFFKKQAHYLVKGTPLIPADDPTLLFTNAGMNQFKPIFLGLETPKYTRVVNSQRCMRVSGKHNDLEEVGFSPHHHTLFEMLGNWSFGDYYKKESITWAWELLTEVWNLPKEKLWVSVFQDQHKEIPTDEDAAHFWEHNTDVIPGHIVFFGRKDNFWEMGETGPCGPCTEIHIDRGPEFCNLKGQPHRCSVNGDCRRYIELWNLVFIQYQRRSETILESLPQQHVDTGMGLERITSIIQNANSNYDTDLFLPIMDRLQEIAHHENSDRTANQVAYKVVADHARASAFLITDGLVPSNEWRGYVLRRIIRRAVRFGTKMGIQKPFLYQVAQAVLDKMGPVFPEMIDARDRISQIIKLEEERFFKTLSQGMPMVEDLIASTIRSGKTTVPGNQVFKLYDTFGFPADIIADIAREENLTIDQSEFQKAMDEQKTRARSSWKGHDAKELGPYESLIRTLPPIQFKGYESTVEKSKILTIVKDLTLVEKASAGDDLELLIDPSPFYAESGGQVGDTGTIESDSALFKVKNTLKLSPGLFIVQGSLQSGELSTGDPITARVDSDRRAATARNHTATHLLHAGLRSILGTHVKQSGSLVTPDRLRFDFSHFSALDSAEITQIESFVNEAILKNIAVSITETDLESAIQQGVIALFEEKYQENVRVIGIPGYSAELCGGTHVPRTGDIGFFKILTESSISSGIRRIEAVTGKGAMQYIDHRESVLKSSSDLMKCDPESLPDRIDKMQKQMKSLLKQLEEMKAKNAEKEIGSNLEEEELVNGVHLIAKQVDGLQMNQLRDLADMMKGKMTSGIIVLGSKDGTRANLVVSVTKDISSKYPAGKIIATLAKMIGGGGGGRPDMAQAGGSQPENLEQAIASAATVICQV